MTDEHIVKALEYCVRYKNHMACRGCPFSGGICEEDGLALQKHSLDLIKRQQTEIEDLKADKEALINGQLTMQKMYINAKSEAVWDIATEYEAYKEAVEVALVETRSEAVREFAKRLKEHSSFCVAKSDGKELYETKVYTIRAKIIDEIAKEMTEERK